jgi:hypothetical protein
VLLPDPLTSRICPPPARILKVVAEVVPADIEYLITKAAAKVFVHVAAVAAKAFAVESWNKAIPILVGAVSGAAKRLHSITRILLEHLGVIVTVNTSVPSVF